jgi:integrase
MWLNFLLRHRSARRWFEAERDEFEDFTHWRMTDERNPRPVTEATWRGDLAALSAFYGWAAHEYGVHNPIPPRDPQQHRRVDHAFTPPSRRPALDASTGNAIDSAGIGDRDVTWLTPPDYQRWVDLGLHGIGPDGREARVWRGRNTQRDAAFADLLYGTGLRLQEAGSLLVDELPPLHRERPFYSCVLATRCATGSRGRNY